LEIAALMSAKEGLAAVTVSGVSGALLAWQYWDEPVKRQKASTISHVIVATPRVNSFNQVTSVAFYAMQCAIHRYLILVYHIL
jgi:hypothetical protein